MNKRTLQHAMVRKKGRNTSVSRSFTLVYSNSELVVAVLLPSCCAILSSSFLTSISVLACASCLNVCVVKENENGCVGDDDDCDCGEG
jgi:hypothetical protein